jgi:hypothetical protein
MGLCLLPFIVIFACVQLTVCSMRCRMALCFSAALCQEVSCLAEKMAAVYLLFFFALMVSCVVSVLARSVALSALLSHYFLAVLFCFQRRCPFLPCVNNTVFACCPQLCSWGDTKASTTTEKLQKRREESRGDNSLFCVLWGGDCMPETGIKPSVSDATIVVGR